MDAKEMTRFDGRYVNVTAVCLAAWQALDALSDMTTEQFSHGADREIRRNLAKALGFDPADYSL